MITRSSGLLFTAIGMGLANMVLLCLSDAGATLEPTRQHLAQIPLSSQTTSPGNVLFVNPRLGDETLGNGSERAPFKTITQALQIAQPKTVIVLSTGTYNTSSGETFPLILKPGVSIQGNPRTRGRNIVIQGGGIFLSPTFARQNITILGANQASVTGVSVTNTNPRGYGLWIESSSPVVIDNTFTKNSHDGISITGNSAPIIRSNYFYRNGANGMTVYGTSRPQVRENVFKKTGFAINVAQNSAPMLVGNRITKNRIGIVAQANARPVLRSNVIEDNTEDGVVAIATSKPNLGTKTEPGGNVFRQNGGYDVNSSASSQVIPAFGNQLANARTSGRVDLTGTGRLVTTYGSQTLSQPTVLQPEPTELSQSIGESARAKTTMTSIDIPVPPAPEERRSVGTLPVLQPAPIVVSELLLVPNSNVPIGNPRNLPTVVVSKSPVLSAGTPPLPPTRATALGLRYRVVVEAASAGKQALVRSLIPGAFRLFLNGRVLMQAGAFSDRAQADETRRMLRSKGLRAAIEQLN